MVEPPAVTQAVCHDGVHATVRADLLRRDAGEHFYLSGTPGISRCVGREVDLINIINRLFEGKHRENLHRKSCVLPKKGVS